MQVSKWWRNLCSNYSFKVENKLINKIKRALLEPTLLERSCQSNARPLSVYPRHHIPPGLQWWYKPHKNMMFDKRLKMYTAQYRSNCWETFFFSPRCKSAFRSASLSLWLKVILHCTWICFFTMTGNICEAQTFPTEACGPSLLTACLWQSSSK